MVLVQPGGGEVDERVERAVPDEVDDPADMRVDGVVRPDAEVSGEPGAVDGLAMLPSAKSLVPRGRLPGDAQCVEMTRQVRANESGCAEDSDHRLRVRPSDGEVPDRDEEAAWG